jgi:hypothetical protein
MTESDMRFAVIESAMLRRIPMTTISSIASPLSAVPWVCCANAGSLGA